MIFLQVVLLDVIRINQLNFVMMLVLYFPHRGSKATLFHVTYLASFCPNAIFLVCFSLVKIWMCKIDSKWEFAQETQTGVLYQPRWGGRQEGGSKGRGYMYTYGWFMLKFNRKQQNSRKKKNKQKKIWMDTKLKHIHNIL